MPSTADSLDPLSIFPEPETGVRCSGRDVVVDVAADVAADVATDVAADNNRTRPATANPELTTSTAKPDRTENQETGRAVGLRSVVGRRALLWVGLGSLTILSLFTTSIDSTTRGSMHSSTGW